jgi:hypothetical protein
LLVGADLIQSARVMAAQFYLPQVGCSSTMIFDGPLPGGGIAGADTLPGAHDIGTVIRRGAVAGLGPGVSRRGAGGAALRGMIQSQQMAHFVDVRPLTIDPGAMRAAVVFDVAIVVVGGIGAEKGFARMEPEDGNRGVRGGGGVEDVQLEATPDVGPVGDTSVLKI